MAALLHENVRFKKCEAKFVKRCEQTKGKVKYKRPPPDETCLKATVKRRRRMEKKLALHMSNEEKRQAALERQSRDKFQEIEAKLEDQCKASIEYLAYTRNFFNPYLSSERYAGVGVKYEGPDDKESQAQTDCRRRRLRRWLKTHDIVQKKYERIREVIISLQERVENGIKSKYAKSHLSPEMLAGLKALKRAKKKNPGLTFLSNYPGKPEGIHCPCHLETRGYLTIGRAIEFLNSEWEEFPESWRICNNSKCQEEYKRHLMDLVWWVNEDFPKNLLRLCALLDRGRPPEDMFDPEAVKAAAEEAANLTRRQLGAKFWAESRQKTDKEEREKFGKANSVERTEETSSQSANSAFEKFLFS